MCGCTTIIFRDIFQLRQNLISPLIFQVGLAVGDIDKIQQNALMDRYVLQVKRFVNIASGSTTAVTIILMATRQKLFQKFKTGSEPTFTGQRKEPQERTAQQLLFVWLNFSISHAYSKLGTTLNSIINNKTGGSTTHYYDSITGSTACGDREFPPKVYFKESTSILAHRVSEPKQDTQRSGM